MDGGIEVNVVREGELIEAFLIEEVESSSILHIE